MKTFVSVITILVVATQVHATIWRVPQDRPTVAHAVEAAQSGDEILISCGTYFEHDIQLTTDLTIRSENGDPTCVVIDAQRLGRIFECTAQTETVPVVISGITMQNGLAQNGGAFLADCSWGPYEFNDCHFIDNEASRGGGAVYFTQTDQATFNGCQFFGNSSGIYGGACYSDYASGILANDCVFAGNSSSLGGVVLCGFSSVSFDQCTLYGNSALEMDLVALFYSGAQIHRTIIAFNEGRVSDPDHQPQLQCSNLYGNTEGNWIGDYADQVDMHGNFSANPCFCDAENGNFTLSDDSYCLPDNHPWGCDDLVGAYGSGGCGELACSGSVATSRITWSQIKAMYH